jgi:HME family heavy-metal exporter
MLSGVRSQIAIKLFGDDLDTLRGQAEALRARLAAIPGLADLEVEKQVLAPQITVRVDYDKALGNGLTPRKAAARAADDDRWREGHADRGGQSTLQPGAAPA